MAVTLYVKDGCARCDAFRRRLAADEIAYTELNVERQPELAPELVKLTGGRRIVPVLVDGVRIEVAPDGGSTF